MSPVDYIRRAWQRRDRRRGARCGNPECVCDLCADDTGCPCGHRNAMWLGYGEWL